MLRNYFKIALRSLLRYKMHTGINIIGLAIGISACFTIFQIVKYETSFDKAHPEGDQIYRVYTQFSGMFEGTNPGVCIPLGPAIDAEVTGIDLVAPIEKLYETNVAFRNANGTPKVFRAQKTVAFMSPSYFHLFSSYNWLSGSPETSLIAPHQVVLTESKAKQYFGVKDATSIVGKELIYKDSLPVTVSGIVADLEQQSDLNFTDFISYSTLENSWMKKEVVMDNWTLFYDSSQLFIKKSKGAKEEDLTKQFDTILASNRPENTSGWTTNFKLQPLSELHFNSELGLFTDNQATAHRSTLYALMLIAGILLLIASFNFINLTTAQSMQRSKEVGVRKVLGGNRQSLILQFLGETLLLTILAAALSILLTQANFYYFKDFLPAEIVFQLLQPEILLFLVAIIIVVSLLSGFYPAFVLSSFLPTAALKKQLAGSSGGTSQWIRKGLIVLQFGITLVLIACTFLVVQQINYMLNKDLGFDKESIVYFNTSWKEPVEKKEILKNELASINGIETISISNAPPSTSGRMSSNFEFAVNGELQSHHIQRKIVDENYLDVYDIEMVAGRMLHPSDTMKELMINEETLKIMGLASAEEAIGQTMNWGEQKGYPIIGVVKNFHQHSLEHEIEPMVFDASNRGRCFNLKLNTADLGNTLDNIEASWKNVYPNQPFKYTFMDESIARFYETERRTSKLVQSATAIAIFISCIGLFGLVSFAVERRSREIGIRKVLGASVSGLVALLSQDFLKLVGLAFILATPIAWYMAQDWLSNFAFSISIQWWVFALAGLTAIGIAFLTVSFQSVKAALANPVDSLRNE